LERQFTAAVAWLAILSRPRKFTEQSEVDVPWTTSRRVNQAIPHFGKAELRRSDLGSAARVCLGIELDDAL
jgi:hypothetical protein